MSGLPTTSCPICGRATEPPTTGTALCPRCAALPFDARPDAEARARLIAIVESSDDAIISKDLNGIIASWNEGAQRIFGYTASEAIGRPVTMLMPPDRFDEEPAILERVRRGQRIDHYETVRRRKDGTLIDISLTISPVRDATGHIVGASKIARDITDRKESERQAQRRAAQFETLLNRAPLGVYVVDADLRLRHVNPVALAVFDEIPDVIGADFETVLRVLWPSDYAEEVVQQFRHTLATGESYVAAEQTRERRDRRAAETYKWEIHRIPTPDGRGAVVCYFQDVSTEVRARETIQRSEQSLRDANRQKDEFLAMLGHELRNPLAAVRNAVSVASLDPARQDWALEIARRQTDQLQRLIDDLLDVARITQGRITLRKERTTLATVVQRALDHTVPRIEARKLRLDLALAPESGGIDVDPARLEQVFVNLLGNAAKYTEPGGWIRVETAELDGEAVATVRDSGVGIAADVLPRIWNLFAQGEQSLDRAEGGLGIGLTVAKQLVELHGGRVAARSTGLGRGSTFEVRLPIAAAPVEASVGTAATAPSAPASSRRVLIVEDNRDAAESLSMVLELLGHRVQAVHDGMAALKAACADAPDLMLVDIGLPGMDGYEVARRIRREPAAARCILVALTGYGRDDDKRRAIAAGFDHHMVKPVDVKVLQALLWDGRL